MFHPLPSHTSLPKAFRKKKWEIKKNPRSPRQRKKSLQLIYGRYTESCVKNIYFCVVVRVVETQKFIASSTSKYVARLFIDIVKCFFMYFNVLWEARAPVCGVFCKGCFYSLFAEGSNVKMFASVLYTHIKKREYKFFFFAPRYMKIYYVCVCALNYGAFAYSLIIYFDFVIYFHHASIGFAKKKELFSSFFGVLWAFHVLCPAARCRYFPKKREIKNEAWKDWKWNSKNWKWNLQKLFLISHFYVDRKSLLLIN